MEMTEKNAQRTALDDEALGRAVGGIGLENTEPDSSENLDPGAGRNTDKTNEKTPWDETGGLPTERNKKNKGNDEKKSDRNSDNGSRSSESSKYSN